MKKAKEERGVKMTKTATAARKFREDKKEIIKIVEGLIIDVESATTPDDLAELLSIRALVFRGHSARFDNLFDKLSGAMLDYVHSL